VFTQVVLHHDAGFGIFPLFLSLGAHHPFIQRWGIAYLAHIAIIAGLLIGFWAVRLIRVRALPDSIWTAAFVVTAVLANPRLQKYDVDVAIIASTLIVAEAIRRVLLYRGSPLLVALPIALLATILPLNAEAAIYLFILGSALLVVPLALNFPDPIPSEHSTPTATS
jgi:hypothetical protein